MKSGEKPYYELQGIDRLRIEIVRQAIEDYQKARYNGDLETIKDCTDFFVGDWYQMIFDYDGKKIMRLARERRLTRRHINAIKRKALTSNIR